MGTTYKDDTETHSAQCDGNGGIDCGCQMQGQPGQVVMVDSTLNELKKASILSSLIGIGLSVGVPPLGIELVEKPAEENIRAMRNRIALKEAEEKRKRRNAKRLKTWNGRV